MKQIGIGLAGMGTVGTGVFKHLSQNRVLLSERLGLELAVRRVAVRDISKARSFPCPAAILTSNWKDLLEDDDIQIIVELMGGKDEALQLMLGAIERKKIVVTGNKALLAEHGSEIFAAAAKNQVPVFFEAAVGGGIPIIKSLREAFIGNHIRSIHCIINGTTNYILTRMTEQGLDYKEALTEAQAQGYAEADPTLDVNGWDAGHKAIILSALSYGFWPGVDKVHVEGVEKVTAEDIRYANMLGYRIKLLGIIKADDSGGIEVRVHPTLIPQGHVLASVNGVYNAMLVQGDVVGQSLFYGRGAGQDPTASAVIADIAEAAIALESPRKNPGFIPHGLYGACQPIENVICEYYLRIPVADKPGVLAQVAGILGEHGIGISSMFQPDAHGDESVPIILMIHYASNGQMSSALKKIAALPVVESEPQMLRVETFEK